MTHIGQTNLFVGTVFSGMLLLLSAACNKEDPTPATMPAQPVSQHPGALPAQQIVTPGQPQPAAPAPAGGISGAPTAPTVPQPAAQPPNATPMSGLMGALGAMQGQQQGGGAPVKVIQWQSLTQALPLATPGWTLAGQPKGESATVMGISVANASCKLTQGNMTAKVEIVDTSMNPMLAMPFNMARSIQVDSSEERMGPINFGTYPGTQKLRKTRNQAEVMVMVKNRIMITVKVDNTASEAAAVGVMQYVNFNHLSSLVEG
jgi:hypothetical protein